MLEKLYEAQKISQLKELQEIPISLWLHQAKQNSDFFRKMRGLLENS